MSPAPERRFLLAKAKDIDARAARGSRVVSSRVLSELTKLSLYEKRAAGRRDRSVRKLMKIKQALKIDNEI
jgi:hypothetical protein